MLLFDTDTLLRFTKLLKYIPEFYFFAVVLKNRNIFFSKIKKSKVTDYAALKEQFFSFKETKSATMNIFRKKYFLFASFV